jgi:signal transduction histidine kinase
VLAVLLIQTGVAWIGTVYYAVADTPLVPAASPSFGVLALAGTTLLVLYWCGWEPARYLGVIASTVAIGAILPLPSEHALFLPQAIVMPSAVALVLAGPAWVIGGAVGTLSIMVIRNGGLGPNLGLNHLLSMSVTVACLVVSRLIIDAARRDAEARAVQAERARQAIEEQANALRATEARNRALLDAVPDSLYRLNRDGLVLERRAPDDSRVRLHSQYEGRTLDDLLNSEIGGQLRAAIGQTLATGQPTVVEYEWRGGGGPHYREARIVPFEEDQVLALIRDVGEHKEAERQRDLYERGEKLRALGQMAGGIAHDLNQALAVVTGYVELALDDLERSPETRNGSETHAFLRTASEAAAQGADAVKRLLTFARQHDQGPPESVDVGQVLQDTIRFTAPQWRDRAQAEGRPIQIDTDAAPGLVVFGWATALREALMNLVLNAVDALPNGGTIRLTARRQDNMIVVEVADTGTGISPDVQTRIFEPFFTTKGEQGTGLGLAMVIGIVERHNGEIGVSSAEGQGTTFSLRLPAASAPADVDGHDAPAAATSPAHILVVDDDVRLARMLAALLARDRHDVDTAASGEEALERLDAGSYDLVISDLSMGTGMNGWDLAQEVARRWPGIRFVLASGWGASIEEHEARRQAVDAVMAKPYRVDEIRRTVTRLTA